FAQAVVVTILDGAELDLGTRLDAAPPPVVVDAQPRGDHGHPGIEAPLAIEAGQRLERLHERFLRELLGLGAITDPALAEGAHTVEVPAVQIVERGRVARLPRLDQLTVAGEIDVLYSDRHAACYPLVGSAECFAAGSGPSCRPDPRTAADAATTGGRSVEAAPLLMEERGGRPDLAP